MFTAACRAPASEAPASRRMRRELGEQRGAACAGTVAVRATRVPNRTRRVVRIQLGQAIVGQACGARNRTPRSLGQAAIPPGLFSDEAGRGSGGEGGPDRGGGGSFAP